MLLKNKKILIMGIRNKWSIAYGIAKSAYENGAKLIFTYWGEKNREKIEEMISEFQDSKAYVLSEASEDEAVREVFTKIKEENGKIDGIVHAIAHANTEDLHNDFIYTSKEGFAHACDVSAYSFVLIARMAKELDMLNENAKGKVLRKIYTINGKKTTQKKYTAEYKKYAFKKVTWHNLTDSNIQKYIK